MVQTVVVVATVRVVVVGIVGVQNLPVVVDTGEVVANTRESFNLVSSMVYQKRQFRSNFNVFGKLMCFKYYKLQKLFATSFMSYGWSDRNCICLLVYTIYTADRTQDDNVQANSILLYAASVIKVRSSVRALLSPKHSAYPVFLPW